MIAYFLQLRKEVPHREGIMSIGPTIQLTFAEAHRLRMSSHSISWGSSAVIEFVWLGYVAVSYLVIISPSLVTMPQGIISM